MLFRRELQAVVEELMEKAESLPEGHPEKAQLLHDAKLCSSRMLELPELTDTEYLQAWGEAMQAFADETKAEADSLPEGHPEKAKLLYHADIASSSAQRSRFRAFFEADGSCEDLHEASRLRRAGRLN
jgi:hypothetical protein